jgi:uncharacterized protein
MGSPDLPTIRIQKFIIQPTPFCNINCRYCYLPNRSSTKVMDTHTLSCVFASIFSSSLIADRVTITWHAGEPMILPIHFYEEALHLAKQQNKREIPVTFAFQTNGTRITQQWCDFINTHQMEVGVSLDGPQYIHDAQRVDRANRGTFVRVMQGIDLLQKNGINPAILMVLTRKTLDYPDAFWQFLLEHRLMNVAFLLEEVLGANKETSVNALDDKNRYEAFLRRILALKDLCANPPFVREIDLLIDRIKYLTHPVWAEVNTPFAIVSFDCEGNVSTFSAELLSLNHPYYKDFVFGNVFENTLEDMLFHPKFMEVNTEIQLGVARCRETCDYFLFCGGGSPANKLGENGTFNSTETVRCKLAIKATTDVVLEHLERRCQAKNL